MPYTTPYVGVTGFISSAEVQRAQQTFLGDPFLKLMVGVLVSDETLAGEINAYPKYFPPVTEIAGIFAKSTTALNMVHYYTRNTKNLSRQLDKLFETVGFDCHGVQLNMAWPDSRQLELVCKAWGDKQIVLQIGPEALASIDNDVYKLTRKLLEYRSVVDYILLNIHCGQGAGPNVGFAQQCLGEYYKIGNDNYFGFGLSGGLCAETVVQLAPLLRTSRVLSINARSKLCGKDGLDPQKTEAYITAAKVLYTPINA
jgi:hypothetical protein